MPHELLAAGKAVPVPVLLGSNRDEGAEGTFAMIFSFHCLALPSLLFLDL